MSDWLGLFASIIIAVFIAEMVATAVLAKYYKRHGFYGQRFYFCGYQFFEVMDKLLFERLATYNGFGFCYEEAAMSMMFLKDCKSADLHQGLVYSKSKRKHVDHAWVTFRVGVCFFVLDLRVSLFPIPWYTYILKLAPITKFMCEYSKFWNLVEVNALFSRMKKPETSYFFTEFKFFRPDLSETRKWGFRGYFPTYRMSDKDFGRTLEVSKLSLSDDCYNIYVSQRVINEFMRDEKLTEPSDEVKHQAFLLHLDPADRPFFNTLYNYHILNHVVKNTTAKPPM